ncbi:glutaminase [Sporothrix schenckii 1099-18]|uniref:Glutaminase n=1 Tax=Sporothrix schenckii 1099-18 TaxID=1397361 RepID=A0A0F2MGH3_SPOSC|nr:glutaminase [Sporothrix schenckii 1099-18]KJR87266.1 glutaminase [Sporothrix schenckii 1099-18]
MKFSTLFTLASTAVAVLASRASLPSYPIANRNPYVSAWVTHDASHDFPSARPYFWQGQALTWQVLAKIDNTAYCLFSCTNTTVPPATQLDLEFTATTTTVTLQAGPAVVTLTFFSPVSPDDYVRQSLPFSYLTVEVTGLKKPKHGDWPVVDIMSEIDASWTGQGNNVQAFFSETKGGSRLFVVNGTSPVTFGEKNQMAVWGNVVLAAHTRFGAVSWQADTGPNNAAQLSTNGTLTGKTTGYVPSNHLALSYRLTKKGNNNKQAVTFVIGIEQEQAFNAYGEPQAFYYRSRVAAGAEAAVDYVFSDLDAARAEGQKVDATVVRQGAAFGPNYTDILEASVRQTFAALEIVVPGDTLDTAKASAWMKEISTDGNVQTTADLLPKAWPIFYVMAPDYMRLLLNPLLEYALTWPAEFGFHDLGKKYPNATGETVAAQEALIVDQTAVMHWMAYAYQKATGNTAYIKPYLAPLQKFADYLVNNGLYTAAQQSSVDSIGATANQTVLAMYSAVALTSFGALTGLDNYTQIGRRFADVVMADGVAGDHVTAHFGDPAASWISTYPMGWDKMVGLGTFNASSYALQSDWYAGQLSTYGMPFDSNVTYAVGEFLPWVAVTSAPDVHDGILGGIHAFLTNGVNNSPGPNWWYVTPSANGKNPPGTWPGTSNINKPVVGSYWILLAPGLYE